MSILTDALHAALKIEGLSQARLAQLTGLSTKHVSQLMTGRVPLSVDIALRIERAAPSASAEELMVAQARDQIRSAKNNYGSQP